MNSKPASGRLKKIISFLKEAEKMKSVERIACLRGGKRRENDAEHSWHLALMVITFEKELEIDFDVGKALKLTAVHDLLEIYCGDCWSANEKEKKEKKKRELQAAEKTFALLPSDLATEFRALWDEYEAGETTEAKIVKALDKICYPLQYGISEKIVYYPENESAWGERMAYAMPHCKFSPVLTEVLEQLLDELHAMKLECVHPDEFERE